jgi:hypothetical protein
MNIARDNASSQPPTPTPTPTPIAVVFERFESSGSPLEVDTESVEVDTAVDVETELGVENVCVSPMMVIV